MKSGQEHGYSSKSPLSSTRVIYPSSLLTGYVILLIITKILIGIGHFVSYDLLKVVHVVQFLFITRAFATVALVALQKPFSAGTKLTKQQWFRVFRHAVISSVISLLSLFGLTQCGPLRTILLLQHKDIVVISGASAFFTGSGGHSKFRGALCLLVGVLALLFLDHDDEVSPTEHPEGLQHHGISHLFYYVVTWLGLADHKGGVLLLVLVLCLQTGFNNAARRLSVDVGGAKRLNALSSLVSTVLLAPWAFFLRFSQTSTTSWIGLVLPLFLVALLLFVLEYYVEAVCMVRLDAARCARIGAFAVFVTALFLGKFWNSTPMTEWSGNATPNKLQEEHALSGGVIFSWIMFAIATLVLTAPQSQGSKGTFVGYSAAGLPLYTFTGDSLQRTSQSILIIIKNGLKQIIEESDSRKIFYFLCLNLAFTFIEMIYGIWTNSLGLISDGFHMLFDCSALVMGLCASLLARKKPTKSFPFGFGRIEVLSGFINGLFLVVVSFMVFTEALSRLFDPPKIITERLLTVSLAGLCVNLVGIFVFRHSHSHSHGHGHAFPTHSHGHAHSHSHHHADNTNIQGVFLHVLADTLGSIGVITSSLLIEHFGLYIADPVCSLFIAVLIFLSVIPLLKHSASVLVLQISEGMEKAISGALYKVLSLEGVLSYRNQHFWQHSAISKAGSIHVQVKPDASEQKLISQVTNIFKELGFYTFTVQVEKEEYFHHMSALSVNYQHMLFSASSPRNDFSTTVIKAI